MLWRNIGCRINRRKGIADELIFKGHYCTWRRQPPPGGFTGTLGILRNFTIAQDEVILDLGCGTGRTASHLAKIYRAHVFALDNSETMLSKAKSRALQEGAEVHFVLGDMLDLPFKDNIADLVIVESVLIFLPVRAALQECFRVLKKRVTWFASKCLPMGPCQTMKEKNSRMFADSIKYRPTRNG